MDGETQITLREKGDTPRRSLKAAVESLRQRRLFKVAIAYAVGAWVVVQVAATVAPAFELPEWTLRAVILLALGGFIATAVFVAFATPLEPGAPQSARHRRLALAASAVLVLVAGAGALLYSQGAALLGRNSVNLAVVPFADLSPAGDKAYFAEGVAEEILSTLAAEKDIKVLGRSSARQIEKGSDPQAIRSSLGVTHLLEGSMRTAGDSLRINVRLIDTTDGSQLWEEKYQGRVADVFTVQDRIAHAVVRRLRGTFLSLPARDAAMTTSIDAYESYLAARAIAREPSKQSLNRALRIARQIIEVHPDYASGHALYADLISNLADGPFSYGDIPPEKARKIAHAHAMRAIRLAPDKAEGFAALGLALPAAESVDAYRKALVLDPSLVYVRNRLAIALNQLRRNDEAFQQYRISAEMDPLSSPVINRYAQALAVSGKVGEATRAIAQFAKRSGMQAEAWRFRGNTFRYQGLEAQHITARKRALALDPRLPYQHEWIARALGLLGLADLAQDYVGQISPYFQLFVADDRGALKQAVVRDGAHAWIRNGVDAAVFSLARARDWPAIERFYDVRPEDYRNLCVTTPRFTPSIIIALRQRGRVREAQVLLNCLRAEIKNELAQTYRSCDDFPGELEVIQASLLALRDDPAALAWLEKAVKRGWLGQYYSSQLADWPHFDKLRGDPRYAAIQRRIDARIAKERSEVVRMLGHGPGPT